MTSSVSIVVSVNPSNTTPSLEALPRGDDLEAPRDAFPFVIHHGQYVLAGVDVQRLLVKSVRFPKVSVIEMPVDRGFPASMNCLENRASAAAVELLRESAPASSVRIQQCERGTATRLPASAIRAQRRHRAIFGVHAAVVELLGGRQHEPAAPGSSRREIRNRCRTRCLPVGIEIARAGCEDSARRSDCRAAPRCGLRRRHRSRESRRLRRCRYAAARASGISNQGLAGSALNSANIRAPPWPTR